MVALKIKTLFVCAPFVKRSDQGGVLDKSGLNPTYEQIKNIPHQKELRSIEPLQKREKFLS